MFVLFASCLLLPVPLFTHHSAEKRRLGDCALGEGMYSQWGESFRRPSLLPPWWTSLILHFSIQVHRFCRRRLQERSHTQSDTCRAPSVTSSSLHPLINPAFPCGRSLRRRCLKKKKKKKGELPLSTHNETISLVWQDPVPASSSRGCG